MEVPKIVISIFDKHDTACPAPGKLEQVPWLLHTLTSTWTSGHFLQDKNRVPDLDVLGLSPSPAGALRGGGARWALFPLLLHSAHGPVSCPRCPMQAGGSGGGVRKFMWPGGFLVWCEQPLTAFTCEFCLSCEALWKSQGLSEAPAWQLWLCLLKMNSHLVASAHSALVLLPFTSYSVIWVHGSFQ